MIEINLLPAGEKKRRPAGRSGGGARRLPSLPKYSGDPYTAGLGALGLAVLAGLGFLYWRADAAGRDAQSKLEAAVNDSVRYASTIQLVDAHKARQDTIESKIDLIRSVDERRYVWPHLLDEIGRALPPYTWLTKVAAVESDAAETPAPAAGDTTAAAAAAAAAAAEPVGPAFNLEGSTGSTQALTRFMKSLEASPFIRDVTLVTSEQAIAEGRSFQKFTLEGRYEVPDSSFIETVPVISVR